MMGKDEMVELLTQKGADLRAKDRWEYTPLQQASIYAHRTTKELLKLKMDEERKSKLTSSKGMLQWSFIVLTSLIASYTFFKCRESNAEVFENED